MAFVTYYEPFNLSYLDKIFSDNLFKSKRLFKEDLLETHCDLLVLNESFNLSALKDLPTYILALTSVILSKKYYSCVYTWYDEYYNKERVVTLYSLTTLHLTLSPPQKKKKVALETRFKDCPLPTEFITITNMHTKGGRLYGTHVQNTKETLYEVFEITHDYTIAYKNTSVVLYNCNENLFWKLRQCEIVALKGYTFSDTSLENLPTSTFLTDLISQLYNTPGTLIKTEICVPSELLTEGFNVNLLQHINKTYLNVCMSDTVGFVIQVLNLHHVDNIYICKADSTNRCQVEFLAQCLKVTLYRFYTGVIKFCVPNIGMVVDVSEFSRHDFKCQFLIKADTIVYDPTFKTFNYPCGCQFEVGAKVKFEPSIIEFDNLKKVFNCQGSHVCPI